MEGKLQEKKSAGRKWFLALALLIWDKSKRTQERAIELDPNNPTAHLNYGNLLQYTGHAAEGLKEKRKSSCIGSPVIWCELGAWKKLLFCWSE